MATNNKVESDKRAEIAAQKAKQYSPSVQYAIVTVLPNIMNGVFWGFTDMKGIMEHLDAIRNSGSNIIARQLKNDCLLEVNPAYLLKAVQAIDPTAIKKEDQEIMLRKRAEAQVAFEKFLISKGKESARTGRKFGGTIGIYCVNEITTISYKGVSYPAFRVSIDEALSLLRKYGYQIRVGGSFVTADTAYGAKENLWKSMTLSPTKTGIFIDVKCTYSADQMKELEKRFKAQIQSPRR